MEGAEGETKQNISRNLYFASQWPTSIFQQTLCHCLWCISIWQISSFFSPSTKNTPKNQCYQFRYFHEYTKLNLMFDCFIRSHHYYNFFLILLPATVDLYCIRLFHVTCSIFYCWRQQHILIFSPCIYIGNYSLYI